MRILVTYNPTHIYHNQRGSPENPERIESIYRYLKSTLSSHLEFMDIREPATMDDILAVHTEQYLDFLERMSRRGETFLGDSTYLNKYSYMAALIAAEASIIAVDEVLNMNYDTSYALIRPPGHHASSDMYGGFCLLNNGAIATKHLLGRGLKKIAIIDWDAHAANGTMKIFYSSADVLLISIHRDPTDYYPHEGFMHQIGRGEGTGYTVNITLPQGAGDEEYLMVFDRIITPIIKDFSPDFIIGENGFDPHYSHTKIGMQLTVKGFVNILKKIKEYNKPFSIIQEGGYTSYNPKIAAAMMRYLINGEMTDESYNSLSARIMEKGKVRKKTEEIIEKLTLIFSDYFNMG